jgi:hypothetical protein
MTVHVDDTRAEIAQPAFIQKFRTGQNQHSLIVHYFLAVRISLESSGDKVKECFRINLVNHVGA